MLLKDPAENAFRYEMYMKKKLVWKKLFLTTFLGDKFVIDNVMR
jgi:hypothetical protein